MINLHVSCVSWPSFSTSIFKTSTIFACPFIDLFFEAPFPSDSCLLTDFLPIYSARPQLHPAQLGLVNMTFWETRVLTTL